MKKTKILIVEDTLITMDSLKKLLERQDYEVDAFPDTMNVMQNVEKEKYDLAIIDIIIGNESKKGLELAKEIRTLQNQKLIPTIGIFILTIHDTFDYAYSAINDFQADAYIVKTVEDKILLSEIHKYLEKRELEILNDPVIKAFEDWVKSIDPNDFTIQTLDDDDNPVIYNAKDILDNMISQTELGVNFKNSISAGTRQLIFKSLSNNK
jgi:DNA-binding NtrC family response regulator